MSLITAVAAAGTLLVTGSDRAVANPPAVLVVLAQIALVQAGLLVYVARVGRGRWVLADTERTWWRGPAAMAVDAGLAVIAALVIVGAETIWHHVIEARPSAASRAFLPHTTAERVAWAVVATLVGVVEEVVYRGYLQRHLGALLRSAHAGLVATAVLFGLAHLEQGAPFAARAVVYGLLLGFLTMARGSLVPAVVAHVAIDLLAGLARAR